MEGGQQRNDFRNQVSRIRWEVGSFNAAARRSRKSLSRAFIVSAAGCRGFLDELCRNFVLLLSMHDVLIIGAGPAGLSAALWCDELGLDTIVLEQSEQVGGQLLSIYGPIADYPGVRAQNGRDFLDRFSESVSEADFDLWT